MTRVDIERGPSMFGMSRSLSQQIINLNLIVEEKLSCAVCARISCWNVQKMSAESQLAQVALAPSPFKKKSNSTRALANCNCNCRTVATAFMGMRVYRCELDPIQSSFHVQTGDR